MLPHGVPPIVIRILSDPIDRQDPIGRQTYQSAKQYFFGRATLFEEATVEQGGSLGKENERGDLEDVTTPIWDP